MEEVFVIRTKHYEFKLREKSVFVEVVERKTLNDGRIMTGHSDTEVCSLFEDLGIRDYQSFLSKVYGYRAGGGAWPEWKAFCPVQEPAYLPERPVWLLQTAPINREPLV